MDLSRHTLNCFSTPQAHKIRDRGKIKIIDRLDILQRNILCVCTTTPHALTEPTHRGA